MNFSTYSSTIRVDEGLVLLAVFLAMYDKFIFLGYSHVNVAVYTT